MLHLHLDILIDILDITSRNNEHPFLAAYTIYLSSHGETHVYFIRRVMRVSIINGKQIYVYIYTHDRKSRRNAEKR